MHNRKKKGKEMMKNDLKRVPKKIQKYEQNSIEEIAEIK